MSVKLISSDGHEFIIERECKGHTKGPGQFAEKEANDSVLE